jgi:hypothetical protein
MAMTPHRAPLLQSLPASFITTPLYHLTLDIHFASIQIQRLTKQFLLRYIPHHHIVMRRISRHNLNLVTFTINQQILDRLNLPTPPAFRQTRTRSARMNTLSSYPDCRLSKNRQIIQNFTVVENDLFALFNGVLAIKTKA